MHAIGIDLRYLLAFLPFAKPPDTPTMYFTEVSTHPSSAFPYLDDLHYPKLSHIPLIPAPITTILPCPTLPHTQTPLHMTLLEHLSLQILHLFGKSPNP